MQGGERLGAGEMAQQIKVLNTTPNDLSQVPRSHIAGENWLLQVVL